MTGQNCISSMEHHLWSKHQYTQLLSFSHTQYLIILYTKSNVRHNFHVSALPVTLYLGWKRLKSCPRDSKGWLSPRPIWEPGRGSIKARLWRSTGLETTFRPYETEAWPQQHCKQPREREREREWWSKQELLQLRRINVLCIETYSKLITINLWISLSHSM